MYVHAAAFIPHPPRETVGSSPPACRRCAANSASTGQAYCRTWHRHAVRTVELGRHGRRPAVMRRNGVIATFAPTSRRSANFRSIFRTTPPPCGAGRVRPGGCGARLVTSTSALPARHRANGRFCGPTGNAGALGSCRARPDGKPAQLIDVASIAMLEKRSTHAVSMNLWTSPDDWGRDRRRTDNWIARAASARLCDRGGILGRIEEAGSTLDAAAGAADCRCRRRCRRRQ